MFREPAPVTSHDPQHVARLVALFNTVNCAVSHVADKAPSRTASIAALSQLRGVEGMVREARRALREHIKDEGS